MKGVGHPTASRRLAIPRLGLALLALAGSASGQPAGVISGVVLDATTQAPLAGAVIAARSPALLGEQSAVTDDAGAFEMTMLPPGSYALAVQHDGFLPVSTEGLAVRGRRIKVRLQLVPEPRPAPPPPAPVAQEFDPASMVGPAMISGPEPEYTQEAIERGVQG